MSFNHRELEQKWQAYWENKQTFKTDVSREGEKFYALDMFPYPSGAGLHVGHPEGYTATDILSRMKRMQGYNVLHPMGYDSFGLPAEQYAIQTGQHPAVTTEENINRYKEQLDGIGFSYDWSREVRTSSPEYYKWTQWIFMQLFKAWYNHNAAKAEPIEKLVEIFAKEGNKNVNAACDEDVELFDATYWNALDEEQQRGLPAGAGNGHQLADVALGSGADRVWEQGETIPGLHGGACMRALTGMYTLH